MAPEITAWECGMAPMDGEGYQRHCYHDNLKMGGPSVTRTCCWCGGWQRTHGTFMPSATMLPDFNKWPPAWDGPGVSD